MGHKIGHQSFVGGKILADRAVLQVRGQTFVWKFALGHRYLVERLLRHYSVTTSITRVLGV